MKYHPKGFTLIELIIVLVIVSIMAAMVSPTISRSLASLQLKTAARKVAAALRYARTQAVAQAKDYQAVFSFDEREVTVSPAESEGEESGEEKALPEEGGTQQSQEQEKPKVYTLPEEVKFLEFVAGEEEVNSGSTTITFRPNGSSDGGEVVLSDEAEKREYRIVVSFLTGAVEVKEKE